MTKFKEFEYGIALDTYLSPDGTASFHTIHEAHGDVLHLVILERLHVLLDGCALSAITEAVKSMAERIGLRGCAVDMTPAQEPGYGAVHAYLSENPFEDAHLRGRL